MKQKYESKGSRVPSNTFPFYTFMVKIRIKKLISFFVHNLNKDKKAIQFEMIS